MWLPLALSMFSSSVVAAVAVALTVAAAEVAGRQSH
jgi:hypothetical protein